MKKRLPIIFGTLLIGAALLVGSLANKDYFPAQAGSKTEILVNDKFNSSEFANMYDGTKWVALGEGFRQSASSDTYLQNNGSYSSGGHVFFGSKRCYQNLEEFQIDFNLQVSSRWFGIKFMSSDHMVDDSNITSPIVTGDSLSAYWYHAAVAINNSQAFRLGNSAISVSGNTSFNHLIGVGDINGIWVTMRFIPISSTQANISFKRAEMASFDEEKYFTITSTSDLFDFKNGQFGIQTENNETKMAIDNIKYKLEGETQFHVEKFENFDEEDPSCLYVNYKYNERIHSDNAGFVLYGNSTLTVKEGAASNDRLIALSRAELDKSAIEDVEVINATFNLRLPLEETTESVAFVFGLSSASAELNTAGGYVAFSKEYDDFNDLYYVKVSAHIFVDGEDVEVRNSTAGLDNLTSQGGSNIEIQINKSGTVRVLVDDVVKAFVEPTEAHPEYLISKYEGYLGFVNLRETVNPINIDDIKVKNITYFVPVTKSVTHNFENDFFGNPGHEDFYIPVNHSGTVEVKNGHLVLTGVADDVMFGSAYQYDQFILEYKLCAIYVGSADKGPESKTDLHKWVGLDLSRKSKTTNIYGSYAMINIEITPEEGKEYVNAGIWQHPSSNSWLDITQDVNIQKYNSIPADWFRALQYGEDKEIMSSSQISPADYVCFRWVSNGDSIELHLKRGGEANYKKYYTFSNLELNGYFALCNTGYLFCEYDDFSMSNTSPVYVCADNETPETIYEEIVIYNYDPGNVDVNLEDEIEINLNNASGSTSSCGGSVIATSVILSSISLIGVVLVAIKKGREKDEA